MRIVFATLQWDKQQNDLSFLPNVIIFIEQERKNKERQSTKDSVKKTERM